MDIYNENNKFKKRRLYKRERDLLYVGRSNHARPDGA